MSAFCCSGGRFASAWSCSGVSEEGVWPCSAWSCSGVSEEGVCDWAWAWGAATNRKRNPTTNPVIARRPQYLILRFTRSRIQKKWRSVVRATTAPPTYAIHREQAALEPRRPRMGAAKAPAVAQPTETLNDAIVLKKVAA